MVLYLPAVRCNISIVKLILADVNFLMYDGKANCKIYLYSFRCTFREEMPIKLNI